MSERADIYANIVCPVCDNPMRLCSRIIAEGELITGDTCPACQTELHPLDIQRAFEAQAERDEHEAEGEITPTSPGYEHSDIAKLARVSVVETMPD